MSKQIQAIETRYKECRFRSRLEARWAVYFDTIGIKWEYEKQGYILGDARRKYLPDFYLPQFKMWAEVKAGKFAFPEIELLSLLCEQTERDAIMLDGPPAFRPYATVHYVPEKKQSEYTDVILLNNCFIGEPYKEGDVILSNHDGLLFQSRTFSRSNGRGAGEFEFLERHGGLVFTDVMPAVRAAMSARFEHGESPIIEK